MKAIMNAAGIKLNILCDVR